MGTLVRRLTTAIIVTMALTLGYLYLGYKANLSDLFTLFHEERVHLLISVKSESVDENKAFEQAIKQVHGMLANRRDVLTEFNTAVFEQRKKHIRTVCSFMNDKLSSQINTQRSNNYYKNIHVSYCSVAKVASKYLLRMFYTLNTDEHVSPFEFRLAKKPHARLTKYTLNSSLKIVFSRDPYRRIYSSYIDKLVSPNSLYWNAMGKQVIAYTRETGRNRRCVGQDVTFGELVKFLIGHDSESYDVHFRPVSATCDVCKINYDIIGKVETFKHDTMYIVNRTQRENSDFLLKDFKEEGNIHDIIFKVQRAFTQKLVSLKCMSHHAVHLRLWRVFQIAGLINKQDTYPLLPQESREANITTVTNLMLMAYHRTQPNSNSKDALLQAYSQIPREDLEKLRLKYLAECMLFDYEDRPSYLFSKDAYISVKNNNFDFFDVLRL